MNDRKFITEAYDKVLKEANPMDGDFAAHEYNPAPTHASDFLDGTCEMDNRDIRTTDVTLTSGKVISVDVDFALELVENAIENAPEAETYQSQAENAFRTIRSILSHLDQ